MAKSYESLSVEELQGQLRKLSQKREEIRQEQLRVRQALDQKLKEREAEERERLKGPKPPAQVVRPQTVNLTSRALGPKKEK